MLEEFGPLLRGECLSKAQRTGILRRAFTVRAKRRRVPGRVRGEAQYRTGVAGGVRVMRQPSMIA